MVIRFTSDLIERNKWSV